MHIYINRQIKEGYAYCYASESKWVSDTKKKVNTFKLVGRLCKETNNFIPNDFLLGLARKRIANANSITEHEELILKTVGIRFKVDLNNNMICPPKVGQLEFCLKFKVYFYRNISGSLFLDIQTLI
jgi:hypothetical protein